MFDSIVADNSGHPAAVHSVQYSQSVYGANAPPGIQTYQPHVLSAVPEFQQLSGYLNQDGVPAQNGRVLPSDAVLQQAYPGADSALSPLSPRRHYPDLLPPVPMSPVRQPYAVAYEQVHVMFDPQQVSGSGSMSGLHSVSSQDPQQQVLLSTAAASVSLSPHVLPAGSASAAGRGTHAADAQAAQQLVPSQAVQAAYGSLTGHPGTGWAAHAGVLACMHRAQHSALAASACLKHKLDTEP